MELSYSKLRTRLASNSLMFISSVIIFYLFIIKIPFDKLFTGFFTYDTSKNISKIFHGIIIITCCIFLIKKLSLQKNAGIKLFELQKPVLLVIPFIYPMSLGIGNIMELAGKNIYPITLLLFLIAAIAKGIAEEITFRGLLQSYFINKYSTKFSIRKIVFISSGIFALMHIINISRYSFVDIINQVISAFFFGVFFGALILKVKNVFIVGVLHGCVNFVFSAGLIGESSQKNVRELYSVGEIITAIITYNLFLSPLLIVGIILLKKPGIKSVEI